MNPYLGHLLPYPFERLNDLKNGLRSNSKNDHVSLSLGEPKHAPPNFVLETLSDRSVLESGLAAYPSTRGGIDIRNAIVEWLASRFRIQADPVHHVLPVNGTREALFSFGQAILSGASNGYTLLPNPLYQIYEGAALLRGSTPIYVPSTDRPDFDTVDKKTWDRCELLYICSPGNPSGAFIEKAVLGTLIELAHKHDFVIAADECYSEIYYHEDEPPKGLLEVATELGVDDFRHCVVFHSLSKRSNCPGLRSGFVAGDANIIDRYFQYRTYHGCAMPEHIQHVSSRVWRDEQHVVSNRQAYREKFDAVNPILSRVFDAEIPPGTFYYWLQLPGDDESFARDLFVTENITVLPGQYLGRDCQGTNPGRDRIRIALVAPIADCIDAVSRMAGFIEGYYG